MPTTEYRKYKSHEWSCKFPYDDVDYDYDKMIYVDSEGEPITGLLENYWYYSKNDPRNWQLVIDGKRVRHEP